MLTSLVALGISNLQLNTVRLAPFRDPSLTTLPLPTPVRVLVAQGMRAGMIHYVSRGGALFLAGHTNKWVGRACWVRGCHGATLLPALCMHGLRMHPCQHKPTPHRGPAAPVLRSAAAFPLATSPGEQLLRSLGLSMKDATFSITTSSSRLTATPTSWSTVRAGRQRRLGPGQG